MEWNLFVPSPIPSNKLYSKTLEFLSALKKEKTVYLGIPVDYNWSITQPDKHEEFIN